mmetsp:Transcript_54782/g.82929  ORF Transcript_54782/g.82929 Transcript_54782/m.82929 type:complete len:466 (+) Transcript_54782:57-1454(+)
MKLFLAFLSLIVSLLSVAIHRFTLAFYPEITCDADPPIEYEGYKNFKWNACKVFSLEYKDAREKFVGLAKEKGAAEVISLPIGTDDYTIDVAIFQGTRPGVILHTSGTHGIEGYAGSAIQLAFLESMGSSLEKKEEEEGGRPTLILVHAMNPYGMANYRRFNEHNVDLNRNGIPDFPQFLMDRHPNIAGYDDFREFISPTHAPTKWESSTLGFFASAIPLLAQHGYQTLKRVLVAGQYHHPQGVFYGGIEWEPSVVKLVQFLESRQLWDDLLVHIDVHTGLGKFGKDTLMFADAPLMEDLDLHEVFPTAESIVTPHVEDKKAMAGYDLTRGMLPRLIQHNVSNCLSLTQEFGTLPGVLVGRALILENAMHHHGDKKEDSNDQGRKWIQQAFYSQSTEWRASIVQRGIAVMLQAIEYSKTIPILEREDPEPAANTSSSDGDLDDVQAEDDQEEQEEAPVHEETESA